MRRRLRDEAASQADGATPVAGPSPNAATNLVLADILLRSAGALARIGVERALLGRGYTREKVLEGRTLRQSLIGAGLARVATRSVPGAIAVGGSMLAKTLYDRHRGKKAEQEGDKALAKQARRGRSRSSD